MVKKLWFFPFMIFIIIVTLLAGCGGPSPNNYSATKQGAAQLITAFKSAVESYDVTGMLGCLSDSDFSLKLLEAGLNDTKTYQELKDELEADESNQLAWRKPVNEGGHAYVLNFVLGDVKYTNTTDFGTKANHTFEVWESASEIQPPVKTDYGTIFWTIIQSGGEWKATEMIIQYGEVSGSGFSTKRFTSSSRCFGLSKLLSR